MPRKYPRRRCETRGVPWRASFKSNGTKFITRRSRKSRFRGNPRTIRVPEIYRRGTPESEGSRSIYLNDCLREPRWMAGQCVLASARRESEELTPPGVVALSIFHYTETSVEDLILFAARPLGTLTDSYVIVAARFFTDLHLTLCRQLQRDRVGVEFLRQQEIFETLHLLTV